MFEREAEYIEKRDPDDEEIIYLHSQLRYIEEWISEPLNL